MSFELLTGLRVILPVKPFDEAKSRLASVLSRDERQSLARQLFLRSLRVIGKVVPSESVLVVSRDSEALRLASELGAETLIEAGSGLNPALSQAIQHLLAKETASVLIIAADLPLLGSEDVASLVAVGSQDQFVLAPDRVAAGTNALLLRPPDLLQVAFGPGSFPRHQELGRAAGSEPRIIDLPGLAFDLDSPSDLGHLRHMVGEDWSAALTSTVV